MTDINFYQKHSYTIPEIAICLEDNDLSSNRIGKFFIPALTPFLEHTAPYDKKDPIWSTENIVSGTKGLDIKPCTMSNYLEIRVPEYITKISKDEKFVISFIGGDLNKPYVIGRYE